MNYKRQYDLLIERATARSLPPDIYTERHHIVPKSLGGGNEKSNLVSLTAREHLIAHCLLSKIYGGKQYAALGWFKQKRYRGHVNSRLYEYLRIKWIATMRGVKQDPELVARRTMHLKGNTHTLGTRLSAEHRAKISKSLLGNKHTAGKIATAETRAKMSAAHAGSRHHYFGKSRSDEVKVKLQETLTGRKLPKRSPEHSAKISAALKLYNLSRKSTGINP